MIAAAPCRSRSIATALLVLAALAPLPLFASAGPSACILRGSDLIVTLESAPYRLVEDGGAWRIDMEGSQPLNRPGLPELPVTRFVFALPPGTRVESVELLDFRTSAVAGYLSAPGHTAGSPGGRSWGLRGGGRTDGGAMAHEAGSNRGLGRCRTVIPGLAGGPRELPLDSLRRGGILSVRLSPAVRPDRGLPGSTDRAPLPAAGEWRGIRLSDAS
jgi:hypothetical protein